MNDLQTIGDTYHGMNPMKFYTNALLILAITLASTMLFRVVYSQYFNLGYAIGYKATIDSVKAAPGN